MVIKDELIQRHAYNNNSNTSPLKTRQSKSREVKSRQDEIYIDLFQIITMTMTTTITMTIIIQ